MRGNKSIEEVYAHDGMFGVEKQPFSWRKVIGAIVAIIGVVVFKWK